MLQKITFRPGINREGTNYANEGGFYDCDHVRFRSGQVEKIGGWTRLSNGSFLGTARSLWNWINLEGTNYLGVGTNLKYYIEYGGGYYDVTPIRKTVNPMLGAVPPSTGNPLSTAYNTLNGSITATQTSLVLTSGASFQNSPGIIKIDSEQIYYTGKSTNTLTGLIRGYNGTTAATHATSAPVGCSTVTVTDVANGVVQNDFVTFGALTATGGFTTGQLNVEQQVFNVITVDKYTFNVSGVFSTSAVTTGGGTVATAAYQINTGLDIYVIGTGWGAGVWGRGGWGSASSTQAVGSQLRLWSNDNYGQDLILAPRNGGVYYWKSADGLTTRAKLLNDLSTTEGFSGAYVPNKTLEISASSIQRFVICFGANPYVSGTPNSAFNPMLVRWSDQANQYDWVPDPTNQAGEFGLSHGSSIVTYVNTRQEILIWTDSALYSMQYVGAPYVWSFQLLMDNISIMSPNSIYTVNNVTYWMGNGKFYQYSGRVDTLASSLRQYVFEDINQNQSYQVFAGGNEGYNEIWWFYCSLNSDTIDKYVIYNYLDKVWYYGTMARTAWLDSGIREYPMATDYNNRVLYHESDVNDVAGTSSLPIEAYIQSSDFDIGDGHNFGFVWRILPDVNFNGSNIDQPFVTMTIKPRQNSGAPYGAANIPEVQSANNYTTSRAYNVQLFDGQVYTRLRGRQMSFRIESGELGVQWQLGTPRIDIRPDGRR